MPYRILLTREVKEQIKTLPGNIKAIARHLYKKLGLARPGPETEEGPGKKDDGGT